MDSTAVKDFAAGNIFSEAMFKFHENQIGFYEEALRPMQALSQSNIVVDLFPNFPIRAHNIWQVSGLDDQNILSIIYDYDSTPLPEGAETMAGCATNADSESATS